MTYFKSLTIEDIFHIGKYVVPDLTIRDESLIESALGRAFYSYYDDIWDQASALLSSLSRNHPFIDGNKRIAWLSTYAFLEINHCISNEKKILCDSEEYQLDNIEPLVLDIAQGKITDISSIAALLQKILV